MEYLLISAAVLCIGINFTLNKVYESKMVKSAEHLLMFPLFTESLSVLLFLCLTGFRPTVTGFGIGMAVLYAFLVESYTVIGLVAVRYGKLAVYTMFLMIGGMLLPYLYGVLFLQEQLTVCRGIGIGVLILSLFLNALFSGEKSGVKTKKRFWILCAAVFVLNGFVSIVSKVHQINPQGMEVFDFMVFVSLSKIALSALALLVMRTAGRGRQNPEPEGERGRFPWKTLSAIVIPYALLGGINSVCMLQAAKTLPATVQYPFVTGGTTLITALLARIFFREKISAGSAVSLLGMFCGTLLFLF